MSSRATAESKSEVAQWQVEAIKEGIAAADAGALIPHEQVKRWVEQMRPVRRPDSK